MNTKRINRYSIAQLSQTETRRITSNSYVQDLLTIIDSYNDNKRNPYFIGDIRIYGRERKVVFNKYQKISSPSLLEEIDKTTTCFNSSSDLQMLYGPNISNTNPVVIIYRVKKRVKALPLLFKKDEKYLNREYILSCLKKYGRDIEFINKILKDPKINGLVRNSINHYDSLYMLRDQLKHSKGEEVSIEKLLNFYRNFIHEKGKFNYYNFRTIALLIRDYESQINYEEERAEVDGQFILPEYIRASRKEYYESLKLELTECQKETSFGKKLIERHETTK